MTTVDALWRELETKPEDTTLKLALIDALLEAGEDRTAETVRWCLKRGRWPINETVMNTYYWTRKTRYTTKDQAWMLPENVFFSLPSYRYGNGDISEPGDTQAAVHQLQQALVEVGEI